MDGVLLGLQGVELGLEGAHLVPEFLERFLGGDGGTAGWGEGALGMDGGGGAEGGGEDGVRFHDWKLRKRLDGDGAEVAAGGGAERGEETHSGASGIGIEGAEGGIGPNAEEVVVVFQAIAAGGDGGPGEGGLGEGGVVGVGGDTKLGIAIGGVGAGVVFGKVAGTVVVFVAGGGGGGEVVEIEIFPVVGNAIGIRVWSGNGGGGKGGKRRGQGDPADVGRIGMAGEDAGEEIELGLAEGLLELDVADIGRVSITGEEADGGEIHAVIRG